MMPGEDVDQLVADQVRRRARERWEADARERAAGIARVSAAVRAAAEVRRPLDGGWPAAAVDLVDVLAELHERVGHPDLVDLVQSAVMVLAGLWMPAEDVETVYLGEALPVVLGRESALLAGGPGDCAGV